MNAIEFLIKEHNEVRDAFNFIENSSESFEVRRKMFESLGKDLIRHETMEHKVWYPHFKDDTRLSDTVKHLLKEENHAEKAVKRLSDISAQPAWEENFTALKKEVEHHASEEEEQLFPEVEKLLSEEKLEAIGADMDKFKQAAQA